MIQKTIHLLLLVIGVILSLVIIFSWSDIANAPQSFKETSLSTNQVTQDVENNGDIFVAPDSTTHIYENTELRYRVEYPDSYIFYSGDNPIYPTGTYLVSFDSVSTQFSLVMSSDMYPNTNLLSAWMSVSHSPTSNCYSVNDHGTIVAMESSDDLLWKKYSVTTAAAGTQFMQQIYHREHEGTCFEVTLSTATSNVSNYDTTNAVEGVDLKEVNSQLFELFTQKLTFTN